jgi:hypothetical protein
VTLLGPVIRDCADANLSRTLLARGYTHLLVRRQAASGARLDDRPPPGGLRLAARFDDGEVFAVMGETAAIDRSQP